MRYGIDDAKTRRQRHGKWGDPLGRGRCRGHRMTGYCELEGALLSTTCGVMHRDNGGMPCPVKRTFCMDHGVTLWTTLIGPEFVEW